MTTLGNPQIHDFGISLTGGGARGSYQAGVLKGLTEILNEQKLLGENNPFQFWSGVSAGSINAAFCASGLNDLEGTSDRLVQLWGGLRPEDVYLTDVKSLSRNALRWVRDLSFGAILKRKLARSLLDTKPLWGLLDRNIQFSDIAKHMESGLLKGLACSAYSYFDNRTVTFLQTNQECGWNRHRRYSKNVAIETKHVVASCAIPVLFPTVTIEKEFFGDGSFRNLSPISPLVHMGAKKIFVIGVRGRDEFSEKVYRDEPGVAKISGTILNALFFDTLEIDLERLGHINELIDATSAEIETRRSNYTRIDYTVVRPSRDISLMAAQKAKSFPQVIRFLLGGLGPIEESAELASYILFVSDFTKDLIELGYLDMMAHKKILLRWLERPQ